MEILLLKLVVSAALFIYGLCGIRVIRPTRRGLVETLGKYTRFAEPGFHWILPIFQSMIQVNVTEIMTDVDPQTIITKDNLNAIVNAQVYFRIPPTETSVKDSQYNVNDIDEQIVALSQTTLRNIIGGLSLKEANSERGRINSELLKELREETQQWGITVVRTELQDIEPPKDVQETMNRIVKAENEKQAAVDLATAMETQADGSRRARIKEAEGRAAALQIEGEAAEKYLNGNAMRLKELETMVNIFKINTKIITGPGVSLVNLMGDMVGATQPSGGSDTKKREIPHVHIPLPPPPPVK